MVVVAIIALLIAILLPSLNTARSQARRAACAARLSQLGKALMMYAGDYNDTPPFMGRGWEDADDTWQDPLEWPIGSGTTVRQWKYFEDWLMPNMPSYWTLPQEDWPAEATVRNGSLYTYTRFESLYRCPEFERIRDSRKAQDAFCYTRTLLGRKWYHVNDPEGQEGSRWYFGNWAGAAGPIVKISQVYSPARLHLFVGERWDRHCAIVPSESPVRAGEGLIEDLLCGQWMVMDPMLGLVGDEVGHYHGQRLPSMLANGFLLRLVPKVPRANAVYYDGHVELMQDPLPDRNVDLEWGLEALTLAVEFIDWTVGHIFAQRGPTDVAIDLPPLPLSF